MAEPAPDQLADAIKGVLLGLDEAAQLRSPGSMRAAVLVPLFLPTPVAALADVHTVLTRRRADLRSHAGEIAFPGGREDHGDGDLLATALRESHEEIGLPPDEVTVLGALPPVSTMVSDYTIYPLVGLVDRQSWRPSPDEVDEVLELSLRDLSDGQQQTRITKRGVSIWTNSYVVGETVVWGATARILSDLLGRLGVRGARR